MLLGGFLFVFSSFNGFANRTAFSSSYEYDNKNRLVKQYYGETSDCYEFTYYDNGALRNIYYVKNDSRELKYTYYYDKINRVSATLDGNELNSVDYTYDADGRVIKTVTPVATVESEYAYDLLDNFTAWYANKTFERTFER